MAKCCAEPCTNEGVVHLFVGRVIGKARDDARYTGASYCSWDHLAADVARLPDNFSDVPRHPGTVQVSR